MVNPVGTSPKTINMVPGQSGNAYVMTGTLQESQLEELQSSLISQAQAASQIPWHQNVLGIALTITAGLYFLGRNANHQMIKSAFKNEKAQKMIGHLNDIAEGSLSKALILIRNSQKPELVGIVNAGDLKGKFSSDKVTKVPQEVVHRKIIQRLGTAMNDADYAFHIKVKDGEYAGLSKIGLSNNIVTGLKRLFHSSESQLQTA